jgi:hypothetical protein
MVVGLFVRRAIFKYIGKLYLGFIESRGYTETTLIIIDVCEFVNDIEKDMFFLRAIILFLFLIP